MTLQMCLVGFTRPRRGAGMPEPATLATGTSLAVFVPCVKLLSLNRMLSGLTPGARWSIIENARKQRNLVTHALRNKPKPALPLVVTVTRVAPGQGLDPHDNLPGACKHVVDTIAAWLAIDDRDERITWRYAQACDGRTYGVGIRFEPRSEP